MQQADETEIVCTRVGAGPIEVDWANDGKCGTLQVVE